MFVFEGKIRNNRRKTSRCRVGNQQSQPTYEAEYGIRTRDTLVGDDWSHHCAIPAQKFIKLLMGSDNHSLFTLTLTDT